MYQPDYERIAKKVVRSCSAVKEDETVTISSRADALNSGLRHAPFIREEIL